MVSRIRDLFFWSMLCIILDIGSRMKSLWKIEQWYYKREKLELSASVCICLSSCNIRLEDPWKLLPEERNEWVRKSCVTNQKWEYRCIMSTFVKFKNILPPRLHSYVHKYSTYVMFILKEQFRQKYIYLNESNEANGTLLTSVLFWNNAIGVFLLKI